MPETAHSHDPASLLHDIAFGSVSVGVATTITNPIDVIKIRLQLQRDALGLRSLAVRLIQQEGIGALFKGTSPALARAVCYGGLRLGFYKPIHEALAHRFDGPGGAAVSLKIAAGCLSGAFAAVVTNPIDLIKVRMQAPRGSALPRRTALQVISDCLRTDGVWGLWRGTTPSVARAAILTAAQVVTYDEAKSLLARFGLQREGFLTHFAASLLSGLVGTTLVNPADVIKTHMFVSGKAVPGMPRVGAWRVAVELYRAEGFRAFFKGWLANWARLGPHTALIFMVNEALREVAGADAV